jgi:hypothetical protein
VGDIVAPWHGAVALPPPAAFCTGLSSTAGSAPSLVRNTSACLETDPPQFRFLFGRQPVLHRSLQRLVALDLRLCVALVADFRVAIVLDRIFVRRVLVTFRVLEGRRIVHLVRLKGGQLIAGIAKLRKRVFRSSSAIVTLEEFGPNSVSDPSGDYLFVCVKLPGAILRCDHAWAAWGGAMWLTVPAFVVVQLLAVCHPGGQGSGLEYLGISNDE